MHWSVQAVSSLISYELKQARAHDISGAHTGRHGLVFPFRPSSAMKAAGVYLIYYCIVPNLPLTLARAAATRQLQARTAPHAHASQGGGDIGDAAYTRTQTQRSFSASEVHAPAEGAVRPPTNASFHTQEPPRPQHGRDRDSDPSSLEPIHMPPPPSYGQRAGGFSGGYAGVC